ncbi:hypothetical protein DXN05_24465 [Deminuibacter soli]|uniref:Uncharacterized protein n=2 Tax=Deminuibacter soli TaxID=2291815 RepID=A0A3E1NCH6_9BACT|nr:hypothetical protein DXN05_24465 [Deminuibacter soli]
MHPKTYQSPYSFARNSPNNIIDPDGNDEFHFHYLTTYIPVAQAGTDGILHMVNKPVTYTWVEVVKDNLANTFYVHRDISKATGSFTSSKPTQFFPDPAVNAPATGVTRSDVFGGALTVKDDDYTALLKILNSFPELEGYVSPPSIGGISVNKSTAFWDRVYKDKNARSSAEKEESQVNSLMESVILGAVCDLALARLAGPLTGETFYRGLSGADYQSFLKTGEIPATSETFVSPTRSFAESYAKREGSVLLEINVKEGTLQELKSIGVRDPHHVLTRRLKLPNIPKEGWKGSNAFFKQEGAQINIGLGNGKALEIFNKNIQSVKVLK